MKAILYVLLYSYLLLAQMCVVLTKVMHPLQTCRCGYFPSNAIFTQDKSPDSEKRTVCSVTSENEENVTFKLNNFHQRIYTYIYMFKFDRCIYLVLSLSLGIASATFCRLNYRKAIRNSPLTKSEEHLVVIFRDYICFSVTLCRQCLLRCLAKPNWNCHVVLYLKSVLQI